MVRLIKGVLPSRAPLPSDSMASPTLKAHLADVRVLVRTR
ncbi:hypothetical protein FOZG_17976 [Fusarium oxysporum Fo47]|uniref:Uncharacterized protein n=1 Tax=Fusarium oxysporum Fo47 TaxID=660027 RepID=W9JF94_FUSOX|nr:hypothetical protein FOZG_17976 [Fusarium oxysporum Fo47]